MEKTDKNIIFFDGICGLCNQFIDFILKHDTQQKFHFCPLQSDKAISLLPTNFQNLQTVVLYHDGKFYSKSKAAIKIIYQLGGIWKCILFLKIVPEIISDKVYDYIAKNRYHWWGKKETCRIPNSEERSRFIE